MGDLFAAAGQGGLFAARGFLFPLHCVQEKLKKREKNLEGFENYRKCSKAGGDISPCRKRQRNEETPARCASEK